MTNNFDFEDNNSTEDLVYSPLDIKGISENISSYSEDKLCEMIVCDRYFKCYKQLSIICMEELAKRRMSGSDFEFENYIEKSLNELPVLDFTIPDIGDVLRQVIGSK